MWVLLLTAAIAGGSAGLTSVPGYSSESACKEAGETYTAGLSQKPGKISGSFVCILVPGPGQQSTVDWWQRQRQ